MTLAYTATVLSDMGHDVYWIDPAPEKLSYQRTLMEIRSIDPSYVIWETKTPVIKKTWRAVNDLKSMCNAKVVLCGDHVTALPLETLSNSLTDIVISGGHYDFGMKEIVEYGYKHGIVEPENIDLNRLPLIDRDLTKWNLYSKHNGNFRTTGTYTQFSRDCWWRKDGGCTFCSWTNLHKDYHVMSVERAIEEVSHAISYGAKEIFDDSGTFPIGTWLSQFTLKLKELTGGHLRFGCNLRAGILDRQDFREMARSGFRFVLFGLESANPGTLRTLNKGYSQYDVERSCRLASECGLEPHVTVMVGFPWETRQDIGNTIRFVGGLFKKNYIRSCQATLCIPYPGTRMFNEAKVQGNLKTENWEEYDMRGQVLKTSLSDKEAFGAVRQIYASAINPSYIFKNMTDLRWLARGTKYLFAHLKDFWV